MKINLRKSPPTGVEIDADTAGQARISNTRLFRSRGDELRHLIETARGDLERWQKELESYCRSIAPVKKLPTEVLSLIFEFYLSSQYFFDNMRYTSPLRHVSRLCVRRLLLVSRRWYQVAMSDPNLWTNISIKIPQYETDVAAYAEEVTPYVVACLERSRALPLHIELDLTTLESLCSVEHGRLASRHFSYDDIYSTPPFYPAGVTSVTPPFSPSFKITSHIEDLLYMLVGSECRHLRRWETLDLHLPGDPSVTRGIWAAINGSAPNLKTLSVQGLYHISAAHGGVVEAVMQDDLKDLHSLIHLRLREIRHFSALQVPWSNILSLDLDSRLGDSTITTLIRFKSLRTLRLYASISRPPNTTPSTVTLSLPHLTEFHLLGHHKGLKAITFQLPALQTLYLSDSTGHIFRSLPEIHAAHIHFLAPFPGGIRRSEEESRTRTIQVAAQYPDAVSLTVHTYNVPEEEANLAHLKETGVLPVALETRVSSTVMDWF